jgi:hypothetical protein
MFFYVECFVISLIVGGWIERDGGGGCSKADHRNGHTHKCNGIFFFRPGNLQANNTVITTKKKKKTGQNNIINSFTYL